MDRFLESLLKSYRFEEMHLPFAVLTTDLSTGEPVTPFPKAARFSNPSAPVDLFPGYLSR
jgi:hypothetical protein